MNTYDEERLAELLGALPPAPEAWVKAAQELPVTWRELDDVVARIEADEEFRKAVQADLDHALKTSGYEPDAALVAALRARLADLSSL